MVKQQDDKVLQPQDDKNVNNKTIIPAFAFLLVARRQVCLPGVWWGRGSLAVPVIEGVGTGGAQTQELENETGNDHQAEQ
jgi:hypothetical protein